jgi:hypothetical protein
LTLASRPQGFDGSAGTAVVTETDAILFTDGRYTIQVRL